jgi:hypothetical protein
MIRLFVSIPAAVRAGEADLKPALKPHLELMQEAMREYEELGDRLPIFSQLRRFRSAGGA